MSLINSIGRGVFKKSAFMALVLSCVFRFCVVHASFDMEYEFDIPASDAEIAIKTLSRYTGNPAIFQSVDVSDIHVNSLKGRYTLQHWDEYILNLTEFVIE